MDPKRNYALVTGASSGLGRHIAEFLVRKGYDLIAVSNEPGRLEELKRYLEGIYETFVDTVDMDLSREESAKSLYNYCQEKKLTIEVLVNNAGMLVYGEASSIPYLKVRTILQLHVTTPALLCRLFSENMVKNERGFILNISSISAVMPFPTISFYGPTKAFLRHFSRALRTELKPAGVHVTCLLPGAMDTELLNVYTINRGKATRWRLLGHPEKVARSGIKALFRNRSEYIPGLLNKLVIWILPVIPHFIIQMIYKRPRSVI